MDSRDNKLSGGGRNPAAVFIIKKRVIIIEDKNLNEVNKILKQSDLYNILPFGKTKVQQLIKSGELPLVKIGNDYITTFHILEDWIREHVGEEIYY